MTKTVDAPSLEFLMNLPSLAEPRRLIEGYLLLKKTPASSGIKLLATSGTIGNQCDGAWFRKGRGVIPPSIAISPHKWSVSTQRLWMPQVKGVEGSFYAISPFAVRLGQISRGDFGIHFDANVPGSAGCCVIRNQEHWDVFRETMAEIRSLGYQSVPLTVTYSAL